MTKQDIIASLIVIFGIITIANVSYGLIPAPWDMYVLAVLVVGWIALVLKLWQWWENRR
ncbi:MAG TPA: hypothetical protein V6C95_23440 [Coleofasciculaceae cyanobacterium]